MSTLSAMLRLAFFVLLGTFVFLAKVNMAITPVAEDAGDDLPAEDAAPPPTTDAGLV